MQTRANSPSAVDIAHQARRGHSRGSTITQAADFARLLRTVSASAGECGLSLTAPHSGRTSAAPMRTALLFRGGIDDAPKLDRCSQHDSRLSATGLPGPWRIELPVIHLSRIVASSDALSSSSAGEAKASADWRGSDGRRTCVLHDRNSDLIAFSREGWRYFGQRGSGVAVPPHHGS